MRAVCGCEASAVRHAAFVSASYAEQQDLEQVLTPRSLFPCHAVRLGPGSARLQGSQGVDPGSLSLARLHTVRQWQGGRYRRPDAQKPQRRKWRSCLPAC